MSEQTCVIVGASHAGVSLALQLRREGWAGEIELLGAETEIPYHRPPLSKEFLAGDKLMEQIWLRPEKMFADQGVTLRSGQQAVLIDRQAQQLGLDSGEFLRFDRLALCTGARVRILPEFAGKSNVHYLRNANDANRLREALAPDSRVVIVGGGYIGLEVAAVLRARGHAVTVLERESRILARVTGEVMSDFMTALHREQGVNIVTGVTITSMTGDDAVESIQCSDGNSYAADVVIVGVGVIPEDTLAESAGLIVNNGIVVDEFAQTSDPNIFAAGDCTRHYNGYYARELRLESVQNANDQARAAAANICGKQQSYNAIPWFWSDQYKIKLQMAGLSVDYDEVVCRGDATDTASSSFALFYLKDRRLIAADCIARPKEFMVSKQLIQQGKELNAQRLADESVDPAALLHND